MVEARVKRLKQEEHKMIQKIEQTRKKAEWLKKIHNDNEERFNMLMTHRINEQKKL